MKFNKASVGDVVTEFNGPRTGVNISGGSALCVVVLKDIGSSGSAVKVQQNTSGVAGYYGTTPTTVPNPATWSDVATVNTNGTTNVTLTQYSTANWVRVVVTVVGGGEVSASSSWTRISASTGTPVVTVAALPAASTAGVGARYMVTNATATTFNSVVAGGGANIVPVFSDGTNWRIG